MSMQPDPEVDTGFLEGLKVWAKVGVELGKSIDEQTASNKKIWERLQANTPVLNRQTRSAVAVSGAVTILNFNGPDAGTYWDLESCMIGGADITTTAAGSAGLYVVGAALGSSPGLGNAVDYATALPNSAFYGFRDVVVNDAEFLIAVIFGGTNAQPYVANMSASVYKTDAGMGRSVNVAGV
jgi:hypothetical protein